MPIHAPRILIRRGPLLLLCSVALVDAAAASSIRTEASFALAYIDPGTGSFLVQALVAAIAGIAVTSRIYWRRIKEFLGMRTQDDDDAGPSRTDE